MNHTIYQFGQFEFSTGTNTVINHQHLEDTGTKLEPKVAALLLYFLQNPQRVISKSELIKNVWPTAKATDNIITWALSKLRKALADDPFSPNYIQTVPKQGFTFIQTVEQKAENSTTLNSNKAYWPWAMLAAVIVVFVISFQFVQLNFGRASIGSIKNVTSLDGVEVDPQLSPSNNWLLFRHKATTENNVYQLNLTPWRGESSANIAIRLTDDDHQYLSAIWGKTDSVIYATRIEQRTSQCEIVKLELNELKTKINQETKVLDCHEEGLTKIALHSSDVLYFSDKIKSRAKYAIYQFDFTSQIVTPISTQSNDNLDEHYLSLSLDQNSLLIMSKGKSLDTHFTIYDVINNKHSNILTLTADVKAAHLSPNNQEIWVGNLDGTITAYKVSDGSSRAILQTSPQNVFNLKAITENLLMYSERQTDNKTVQADIKAIMLSEL